MVKLLIVICLDNSHCTYLHKQIFLFMFFLVCFTWIKSR